MPRGGYKKPGPGKVTGRPGLPEDKKRRNKNITLRPDHYKWLMSIGRGQASAEIEKALDLYREAEEVKKNISLDPKQKAILDIAFGDHVVIMFRHYLGL